MPFLGNTPANTFVSIAKQTITGNGGTSYALSYPVTNGNEIDVFVNNVRQEPTAAYTASGSTITFTEAITVSDSVYVIFNGQAVGTIDAPAGAYLPTTGGTINGSVGIKVNANSGTPLLIGRVDSTNEGGEIGLTRASDNAIAWAIDVYGNTSTPSLRIVDNTIAAVRMNIDGSGRVTKPSQPAFLVANNTGFTSNNTWAKVSSFGQIVYNVGGHWSDANRRFTAPIAGYYLMTSSLLPGNSSTAVAKFYVNGSNYNAFFWSYTNNVQAQSVQSYVMYLNANDYVEVWAYSGASLSWDNDGYFCGYLLG